LALLKKEGKGKRAAAEICTERSVGLRTSMKAPGRSNE
jgi:hypothetical protein